jgi:type II secretory pathway component PulJ
MTVVWVAIALVLIVLAMIWMMMPFVTAAIRRQVNRIVAQNDLLLVQVSEINRHLERMVFLIEESTKEEEASSSPEESG